MRIVNRRTQKNKDALLSAWYVCRAVRDTLGNIDDDQKTDNDKELYRAAVEYTEWYQLNKLKE